jgi:hypothetical protein
MSVTREAVLEQLRRRLEPEDWILAMWEGGSAAFDRTDDWSDIDLQIVAVDDRVDEVLPLIKLAAEELSPISLEFELPQPTWHGHIQAFYQLRDAGEFLLLDLVAMKQSSERKFLQPERHGNPVVHFDKAGIVVPAPIDPDEWQDRIAGRLNRLRVVFPLFQSMITKEINRGNGAEAVAFYHGYTLRPLVELLRIRYEPFKHDFHTHYVQYDVPLSSYKELDELFFVRDLADLADKHRRAGELFDRTLRAIDDEAGSIIG